MAEYFDTQHSENTKYGYGTVHKWPTKKGVTLTDIFLGLVRQLYPTGRAWWMLRGSTFSKFHEAVNKSFIRVVEDSRLMLDSCFPDNDNFSEEDASLWEYYLGLITNTSLSLEVRKQAILRKMAYPGNVKARQHPLYIQYQLQQAGFDVYVHENTQPYQLPSEIIEVSLNSFQHGGDSQHGIGSQHGGGNYEVIANSIDPNEQFSIGGDVNLWATFFIGGENLGDMATVDSNRIKEFRELVLKLKPAHTIAFTFINYV